LTLETDSSTGWENEFIAITVSKLSEGLLAWEKY
jgi:hypothetical protein